MEIKPLRKDLDDFISKYGLRRKWNKAKRLFETNIRHPSLYTELFEPRWRGIYSFQLDKKIGLCFYIYPRKPRPPGRGRSGKYELVSRA